MDTAMASGTMAEKKLGSVHDKKRNNTQKKSFLSL